MEMTRTINMDIGAPPELRWIDKHELIVDPAYQRPLDHKQVERILARFRWTKFGALYGSEREDGVVAITEGQRRLEAARRHPKIVKVPCVVTRSDSVASEAALFLSINDRSSINSLDRFWAHVQAGNPDQLHIRDVLTRAGVVIMRKLGPAPRPGMTAAVEAVDRAIREYGDKAVIDGCRIMMAAWPGDSAALSGVMIIGLAQLMRANPELSAERLTGVLADRTAAELIADARQLRQLLAGLTARQALAETIVRRYNKGLSKNQISAGGGKS